MQREIVKSVLIDQLEELYSLDDQEILREVNLNYHLKVPEISVVTGVRRCGKSTLLRQIARKVKDSHNIHYLNFEEQRLNYFTVNDFRIAYEEFLQSCLDQKKQILIYDEIQNVEGWERWISDISSKRNIKVFISGSNSKLLSSELSSLITGRHVDILITPLSFKESLLKLSNYEELIKSETYSTKNKLILKNACDEYFKYGGFPRSLLYKDLTILGNYYQDIVERDIALRKNIRNINALKNLGLILASQNGRILNQSKTSKNLGLKSIITANKFIGYFKDTYLYSELKLFSKSAKKQMRGHSKFYSVDPILAQSVGHHYGDTLYWVLENHIYNELFRRGLEISYWHSQDKLEVDFITRDKECNNTIIQACIDISSEDTFQREIKAIEKAKKELKINNCLIITYHEPNSEMLERCPYKTIPFYKWALE